MVFVGDAKAWKRCLVHRRAEAGGSYRPLRTKTSFLAAGADFILERLHTRKDHYKVGSYFSAVAIW